MRPTMRSAVVPVMLAAVALIAGKAEAQSASAAVNIASQRGYVVTKKSDGSKRLINMATLSALRVAGEKDEDTKDPETAPAFAPGRNPYVGAQLGYAFGDDGQFASNVVASGGIIYSIIEADPKSTDAYKFYLPVRGNFASLAAGSDVDARKKKIETLIASNDGMRVGIEPYVVLSRIGYFQPTLISSAGWRLNAVKDKTDSTRYLALGKLSAGLQIGIGPSDNSKLPIVIEFNWSYASFAGEQYKKIYGDDARASVKSGEFTVTIPTSNNSGFLTEVITTARQRPVWRLGMVLFATPSP